MKRQFVRDRGRMRGGWRRSLHVAGLVAGLTALAPAALAQTQSVAFDIESQPLSSALLVYARQAGVSVLAPNDLVAGKSAPALRGQYQLATGLERLLAGSGLSFEFVQSNAVRIVRSFTPGERTDAGARDTLRPGDVPDRVVITGTTLKGVYPASSPIEIYTADQIEQSGATTTEQFVTKLPQNLGAMSQYAAGSTSIGPNFDSVTAVDLRGLGLGTTLSLLNGHRMALANSGQSADVSMIPASALARVEVLTDGASAIYGSDAIGGVINFVLRDDFEGAETRLSYGGVAKGGMRQGDASQTFGLRWDGGHGLVAYNFHSASALERRERDYSAPSGQGTLSPVESRHNVLATVSQDVTDDFTLDAQLGLGRKIIKNETSNLVNVVQTQNLQRYRSTTDALFADIAAEYRFSDTWRASLDVAYSKNEVDGLRLATFINRNPVPAPLRTDYSTSSDLLDVMAKLEGDILELPGGSLRFSAGAGMLEESFKGFSPTSGEQTAGELGRRSPYAFAEIFAPLVSPAQKLPFLHRLELSLAARYTDYQDRSTPSLDREFGNSTDPKVGVLWSPVEPLALRATYGTSFRAPSLQQLDSSGGGHYITTTDIGGVADSPFLGIAGYAVPDLGPETATTYTAGFDFRPDAAPGLRISGTYYNIDYTDRIAIAPTGGLNVFATPQLLPDLIYRPPSAAFIEEGLRQTPLLVNTTDIDLSDPAAAAQVLFARPDFWILDFRNKNLALSQQDGIDLSSSYAFDSPLGDATLSANISHILSYRQKGSSTSAALPAVDVPGQPASWRGRVQAALANGPFAGSLAVNYVGDYANPIAPAGRQKIDSWTTVDLTLSYDFSDEAAGGKSGPRFTLSAQNLFDKDPPFLVNGIGSNILYPIGFDPANANPLGRMVVIGVVQKW